MKSFRTFSELESHLDIGDHCVKEERQSENDKLRRDWVDMFTTSVNITKDGTCTPGSQQNVSSSPPSDQAKADPQQVSSDMRKKQQMSKTIGSLTEKIG